MITYLHFKPLQGALPVTVSALKLTTLVPGLNALTKERLIHRGYYDLATPYQSVHVNYLNRRVPNGTHGGVRGRELSTPSYSICQLFGYPHQLLSQSDGTKWTDFCYLCLHAHFQLSHIDVILQIQKISIGHIEELSQPQRSIR